MYYLYMPAFFILPQCLKLCCEEQLLKHIIHSRLNNLKFVMSMGAPYLMIGSMIFPLPDNFDYSKLSGDINR